MGIKLKIKETDHPEFTRLLEDMINRIDDRYAPDAVYIIRVRGWFDHKWLNFSGKGLVQFDSPIPDHPQVAIDEFFKDRTTFPPFTPKRIMSQESWIFDDHKIKTKLPHKYKYERSALNLNRLVKDHSKSALFIWYPSETDQNKRGCVMVYRMDYGLVDTWYVSLIYKDSWKIDKIKGIDRLALDKFIKTEQNI